VRLERALEEGRALVVVVHRLGHEDDAGGSVVLVDLEAGDAVALMSGGVDAGVAFGVEERALDVPELVGLTHDLPEDADELLGHLARRLEALVLLRAGRLEEEAVEGVVLLEDLALHFSITVYHLTSKCRIGSVVDPQLRVAGVGKLRVADASVMPNVVSGNTNAACVMIGEKAAEMVATDPATRSTLVVLSVLYVFLPCTMPGFGYVNERVLPMLWMWALVRVPPVVGPRLRRWLVACSALYAVSLPVELFAAEHAIDQFATAADVLPVGARVLTLNFPPDYSVLNTTPLFHASGMFTLLREAHPQDVWADSPSMPIRHAHPPTYADDPVLIREFAARSKDRKTYCKNLRKGMRPTEDCLAQWQRDWTEFFAKARGKYDYVVLWNSTDDVMPMAGGDYAPVFERGKVRVYGRKEAASAE